MKYVITGAAGFIGANFLHFLSQRESDHELIVIDNLSLSTSARTIHYLQQQIDFNLIHADIGELSEQGIFDADTVIFNFAAETHVDRSISSPLRFTKSNIVGLNNLLEIARNQEVSEFIQISTDEVYGSTLSGRFKEDSKLNPSSPYSATKAGADLLALSYYKTYGLKIKITRSSNNYGPFQNPEKFIPKSISKLLNRERIPIYGTGKQQRDWIFVKDNCEAIYTVHLKGRPGEIYNIGTGVETPNLEIVKLLCNLLETDFSSSVEFVEDRPAHDFRYALNIDKIKSLGWFPKTSLKDGLRKTVKWYVENKSWWEEELTKVPNLGWKQPNSS